MRISIQLVFECDTDEVLPETVKVTCPDWQAQTAASPSAR
jgi:hypothetical protein